MPLVGSNPVDNTVAAFPPLSCAFPYGTEHKFHITAKDNIAFRCCETCGKTSRLRNMQHGISETWEDIKEPAEKEIEA
jgi:hypothetical protein